MGNCGRAARGILVVACVRLASLQLSVGASPAAAAVGLRDRRHDGAGLGVDSAVQGHPQAGVGGAYVRAERWQRLDADRKAYVGLVQAEAVARRGAQDDPAVIDVPVGAHPGRQGEPSDFGE